MFDETRRDDPSRSLQPGIPSTPRNVISAELLLDLFQSPSRNAPQTEAAFAVNRPPQRTRVLENPAERAIDGQGQFHKWEDPGEEFEGTWRGMHDGRFGPLGTLETSEGVLTFPLPTALRDRLQLVREGAAVRIQYTGLQTSKAGRLFKGFEVYVADEEAEIERVWHPAHSLPRAVGEEG